MNLSEESVELITLADLYIWHMWLCNVQKSVIFVTEVMKTVPAGPHSILELLFSSVPLSTV